MKKNILKIFSAFVLTVGIIAVFSAKWYVSVFGDTGIGSIIFTLFGGLSGAASGIVNNYLLTVLLPSLIISALVYIILFARWKRLKISSFYPLKTSLAAIISVVLSVSLFLWASGVVGLSSWVVNRFVETDIYEKEYVSPDNVSITFPEEKRNLIYIYLESMETTFISKDSGKGNKTNLIPGLYSLAKNNVNFSQNSSVGGWTSVTDTSWTCASIVAQTAGIPLSLSVFETTTLKNDYLDSVPTLYDILDDNGYYQVAMFGSDSSFSSKDVYLKQHGVDRIYDWKTASKDGIIEPGYKEWWGMEDAYLYEYAKQVLSELSSQNSPFMFTMLTSDTHHIDGYSCSLCKDEHDEQYENVITCADRQITAFVDWLKEQPFFEDTTIVICGDHKSMDAAYFTRAELTDYERNLYNCIINSALTDNTKNRISTPFDMLPSTLAAMGCEIKGNRLGLGVNLFSGEATLAERYGIDSLNRELEKNSPYYKENFVCK